MKSSSLLPRARYSWLFVLLAAVFAASCVTQEQVQAIVAESNLQLVTAEAEAAATQLQGDPEKSKAASNELLAKINRFVAQHPDNPALTNPLRLRQAILYLNRNEIESAQFAFDEISPAALHTERDKAIYAARDTLIWWYRHARDDRPAILASVEEGKQHMAKLKTAADDVKNVTELRDYFLEARAWIGLQLAAVLEAGERAAMITDSLDPFTAVVSAKELALIRAGKVTSDTPPLSRSVRVALRLTTLLDEAARLATHLEPAHRVGFANPELRQLLEARIANVR